MVHEFRHSWSPLKRIKHARTGEGGWKAEILTRPALQQRLNSTFPFSQLQFFMDSFFPPESCITVSASKTRGTKIRSATVSSWNNQQEGKVRFNGRNRLHDMWEVVSNMVKPLRASMNSTSRGKRGCPLGSYGGPLRTIISCFLNLMRAARFSPTCCTEY